MARKQYHHVARSIQAYRGPSLQEIDRRHIPVATSDPPEVRSYPAIISGSKIYSSTADSQESQSFTDSSSEQNDDGNKR
ncbi:hypothetical protein Y1Q_0015430 [Alligator mississippiensis]|uniref:Uncharacterized protein n=1 Tax=Alligator mississippiensis TaxID=8496 RepID=A0A151NDD3_ALLMI|nr:hypothetical protein Y1Q_0015430 [Alligator mississippiensis]